MSHKPENYPTVSPYLLVTDAEKTLQFVEAVFGAKRLRVFPRDDGDGIAHAEALGAFRPRENRKSDLKTMNNTERLPDKSGM